MSYMLLGNVSMPLHQEVESNSPPFKSRLALVTLLTNKMWWK